jgi:hypothetical protein
MTRKQQRRAAIERQIRRLTARQAALTRTSDRLMRIRLALFVVGLVTAVLILLQAGVWWWLGFMLLFIAAFSVLVKLHRRADEDWQRIEAWLSIKRTHLARMSLAWDEMPPPATVPIPPDHPFALDLDLVGERSVLHLLDTAVSEEGSARLAKWLLATDPNLAETMARQTAVRQLAQMPIFRDKLSLSARLVVAESGEKWPGRRLLNWLQGEVDGRSLRPLLWLLTGVALVNVTLLLLYLAGYGPPLFLLSWALYGVIFALRSGEAAPIFEDAYFLEKNLRQLGGVFGFLERFRFGKNARIRAICAPFLDGSERPSHTTRRVTRLLAMAGLRQNPFLWLLLNGLLPWDIFVADRLRVFREALSEKLPGWLDVWFELEALSSLGTAVYLNPDAIFPDFTGDDGAPLAAEAVGHPLIPDETRVNNDFRVASIGSIYIITGSNMAGKSSFLRTLGVNLALAYAGGPVFARTFSARLFRLYTSIRVADSVTDGFSYFYAEVRRLQGLLAALNAEDERPLFFLIDEIFRGTNNQERLIGSQSYVQALAGENGVGLIATHDLELAKLADGSPWIHNFHFRDGVEDGRMVFDYRLHPGPCPTTNALKIMALAGLPVKRDA